MVNDLWQPKISGYVDAELPEDEMRAMDAHLRGCSSCAAEALRQVQLKHQTKLAAQRYAPSPEFRRKIANQVAARKPSVWRWGWAPAVAMAALVLVVAGLLTWRSSNAARSQQQFLAELTDIHVANLAASTPVDVVSSDRHTVKPWFQGKVPFTFNLPELAGTPFSLLGGRLTYLDHEPGAHLIYNVGSHHVSVFIFRDRPELDGAFSAASSSDVLKFHVESWSSHDLRYFVVGDASGESLQQLIDLLKQASNS